MREGDISMDTTKMKVLAKREKKILYVDGNRRIKVFDADFSKKDVLNEAYNQACVEETGLPVPKVLEVLKVDGNWAIATEYIEGTTMTDLMKQHPEKMEEYMDEFVDLQLRVLSKEAPGLRKLRDKMQAKISQSDLDLTTRYELHTRLDSLPKHKFLCHGDFNPSNIIVTPNGAKYIIDWSHATQGNKSADAARTYLLFALTGFRLSGDQALADQYMDLFCSKSGIEKKYVQQWIPIVAAAQSVKGNPEDRDLLLKWANVVDYE